MLDRYIHALILIAAFPATAFPLLYGLRSAWWIHPIGRALMTKALGLALVIDLTAARQIFGDYPGRSYVLAASFTLIVAGLFYQDAVLIGVQQKARRDPRRGKPL